VLVLQNSLLSSFLFQSQVVEFAWTSIKEWEVDDEAMAFCFQYQRPEKNPRWVKIFTPYVSLFSYEQTQYFCTEFYFHFWACLERKCASTYKFDTSLIFPSLFVDSCVTSWEPLSVISSWTTLTVEAVSFPEAVVPIYQSTWYDSPEDCNVCIYMKSEIREF
jgi:hypothetical protein